MTTRPPQSPPLRLRTRAPSERSALLAAVFGLLAPGGGQVYVGRPGKALMMLLGIGGLFAGGLALTAWTCVRPDVHSLEFVAQAMNLGPAAYTLHATQDLHVDEYLRWYEVGRLYVAVAGLLNLVAICDAWGHVLAHNRRARSWQDVLARRARQAQRRRENARVHGVLARQASVLAGTGAPRYRRGTEPVAPETEGDAS